MKILIIEDEPRAARRLQQLIKGIAPETEILGSYDSIRETVAYLAYEPEIDLIFADIQLSDGLSFEIFNKSDVSCPVIFTTAYDQYAIEAFNTNGIDYLLKPIQEKRLRQAIKKLEKFSMKPELDKIMQMIGGYAPAGTKYKNRFMIRVGDRIKSVSTENIRAIYSMDKGTFILTNDNRNYAADYTLDQMETMLDPANFFRISRKYIVSLQACSEIYAWSNSRLKLEIEGLADHEVIVSRDRVSGFKDWLDK
ncbi:MAG: LytR/AlgR family response regulator transcription factor [Bacteroidales bacterium]